MLPSREKAFRLAALLFNEELSSSFSPSMRPIWKVFWALVVLLFWVRRKGGGGEEEAAAHGTIVKEGSGEGGGDGRMNPILFLTYPSLAQQPGEKKLIMLSPACVPASLNVPIWGGGGESAAAATSS